MKLSIPLTALIFLITLVGVSCGPDPDMKQTKVTYRIAYNVLLNDSTENYEVFIMDLNGENNQNLTNWDGVEWTYVAHGDDIYFISDKDTAYRNYFLYKMKPDGSGKKRISDVRLADSWQSTRKQGTEIIVMPHRSVDTAFYILDTTGTRIKRLPIQFPQYGDPVFSPDGSQIVFRASPLPFKRGLSRGDELYRMNADGSDVMQLTRYPPSDTTAAWHRYHAGPPRWNAGENFITYQSWQNGKYALYAIDPDGTNQRKLTDLEWNEGWHDWSPDGRYLAIEIFDTEQTQFHIGLMDWRTKEFKVLTDSTYTYQQAPVFVEIEDR